VYGRLDERSPVLALPYADHAFAPLGDRLVASGRTGLWHAERFLAFIAALQDSDRSPARGVDAHDMLDPEPRSPARHPLAARDTDAALDHSRELVLVVVGMNG
jgi:hypothetical protein